MKHAIPFLFFSLFLCGGGLIAQIAYQANGTSVTVTGGTTVTIPSFNLPAGSDRLLIVFVGKGSNAGPPNVTGITYNGSGLTEAVAANTDNVGSEIWYLVITGTSSVTSDIVVTFDAAVGNAQAGAASFTGVDSSAPLGNTNTATNPATIDTNTGSLAVTTSSGNVVVDCVRQSNTTSFTFGADQTEIFDQNNLSAEVTGGSFETATGSSVTMSWTSIGASGDQYGYCAAELKQAGALPIELLYFRAQARDKTVLLEWATATEVNNDYFTIERSLNGTDFEAVGEVQGAGDSFTDLPYSYEDNRIPEGQTQLFYNLRQTDFDGTSTVDKVVAVQLEKDPAFDINSVFAEQNKLSVVFTLPTEKDIEISLYDLDGRLILSKKQSAIEGLNQLDLTIENLVSGGYVIQLSDGNQRVSKRFLKL